MVGNRRPRIERDAHRNLFLSATMELGDRTSPVRIRTLSTRGATFDGPILPAIGATVCLRRLEISIPARVVGSRGGRCRVAFGGTVSIDDWVSGARSSQRAAAAGQSRVDAIQTAIRAGETFAATPDLAVLPTAPPVDYSRQVAIELDNVKDLLDTVGLALADDVEILTRHEQELQKFDLAVQIIEHLQTIMGSNDRAGAISRVPMHDLRNRLLGAETIKYDRIASEHGG
jgi:hypothetical protein